eukprot:scaffold4743_cov171-Amphora_coffeaeformis.AAC.23
MAPYRRYWSGTISYHFNATTTIPFRVPKTCTMKPSSCIISYCRWLVVSFGGLSADGFTLSAVREVTAPAKNPDVLRFPAHKKTDCLPPFSSFHMNNRFVSALNEKLDENEIISDETSTRTKKDQKTDKQPEDDNVKKVVGRFLLDIYFAFGYVIFVLGGLLSIGLVLNICGYGYSVSSEGIRIDTLPQLREEAQFRSEVAKSMKEYQQQERYLLEKSKIPSP